MRFLTSLSPLIPLLLLIPGCTIWGDDDRSSDAECPRTIEIALTTPGDNEVLEASIACTQGSDCVDSRTIAEGAQLDFSISIPETFDEGALTLRSDPASLIELEDFEDKPAQCDKLRRLSGTITFLEAGTGAVLVESETEELDRFTVDVQTPTQLDIQRADDGSFRSVTETSLGNQAVVLRALLRGETGDRLTGGSAPNWAIEDTQIARFTDSIGTDLDSASGKTQSFSPAGTGRTNIRIEAGALSRDLPVAVGSQHAFGGAGGATQ